MNDATADNYLRGSLKVAYEASNTNQGRYLSFRVQSGKVLTNRDLCCYASEWIPLTGERSKFDLHGYRPALANEDDRSHITLNVGGHQVIVQGRAESVMCLAPIAACFALGISSEVGKELPAAASFWDGLERFKKLHPTYQSRPPTTINKKGLSYWELTCKDDTAITSAAVSNYYSLIQDKASSQWILHSRRIWPDVWESRCGAARAELTIQPPRKYKSVQSVEEADILIQGLVANMSRTMTCSYVDVVIPQPSTITLGEFIYYFTQVWPDCVLTKCGTRWRPRVLPDGTEKGSVYLSGGCKDSGSGAICIAAIGRKYLLESWMPVMAACALRIDPQIACGTDAFIILWSTIGSSYELSRSTPNPFKTGRIVSASNCPSLSVHDWCVDDDQVEWDTQFTFENEICDKMLLVNLHTLFNTNAFWSGGEALPDVSLSRKDFVDWIMLWEPDSVVESVGRFRVRPAFLEKGGISIERGGAYFAIQTSDEPAMALLVVLSAVMAGIPSEIGALCKFANPFWDYIASRCSSAAVRDRRKSLRQLRDFKMGKTNTLDPVLTDPVEKFVKLRLLQFQSSKLSHLSVHLGRIDTSEINRFEKLIVSLGNKPVESLYDADGLRVSRIEFSELQSTVFICMDKQTREFGVTFRTVLGGKPALLAKAAHVLAAVISLERHKNEADSILRLVTARLS